MRLLELQSIAECFAHDLAHYTISVEGRIENDGTQLAQIHFAICENGFVRLGSDDFADEVAGFRVPIPDLALQRQGIFFDDRRIEEYPLTLL